MIALLKRVTEPFDNPVLRRELRLITARGRFEWVVLVLTVAMTLVIASVAGRANTGMHPAYIGKVLFQTYFGIAHGLVLVAGPAVAASSIASEREGRTYEALALTGMSPAAMARGKFFAAVTNVGAYVLALAPVGALPFLFGGVSGTAVADATALATTLGPSLAGYYGGGFGADATGESYRQAFERARSYLSHLSADDQARILGGTAVKLFRFGG